MITGPRKIDYLVAAIVGFITAVFFFPTLKNAGFSESINLKIISVPIILLPVIFPVLWVIGVALGKVLMRWLSFTYQFAKFVVIGFLNTSIDFGTLNLLSSFLGITKGLIIGGVNLPGFVLAATNSYLWNKFWVFRKERKEGEKIDYSDFWSFLLVVISSTVLNGGTVIVITTYVSALGGLSESQWLNVAKVSATVISLVWNFIGLKLLVFRGTSEKI